MVLCLPAEDHTTSPHARVCGSLLGFLIEVAIAALIVAAVVLAIKVAFYAVSGACQGVSGACQGRVRPGADGGCMTTSAIAASGLRKAFGDKTVLDGIDLDVPAGTVFSLLGPNGAGKTTTVNVLTTLMKADGGNGTRRRARRCDRDQGGARGHRGHRSVRRGGRAADGPGEPAADGGSQAPGLRRGQADRHGPAGAVRSGGVGAEAGDDLLRRYAPEAGSGDDAGRQPPDHLPGRADDGAGSAQPPHDVGDHPRAGGRAA